MKIPEIAVRTTGVLAFACLCGLLGCSQAVDTPSSSVRANAMEDCQAGRFGPAIAGFERVLKSDPRDYLAHFQLATLLQEQRKDYLDAIVHFRLYLDMRPSDDKTTLAAELAEIFGAAVAHTDDFVIPHAQKTAERLAVPGGNCDAERLVKEIAAPWKRGGPVVYRRYDCRRDCLLPEETLPDCRILILEGSYCNLPAVRELADVRIFLDAPWETRLARLRERESEKSLQMFFDRWIPLENAYFRAYGLPDRECVLIGISG